MNGNVSPGTSREVQALTGLRALLMLGVLLNHLKGTTILGRVDLQGDQRMPLFFILSGYVLALAYFPNADRHMPAGAFVRRRFARLWPVLAFTGILMLPHHIPAVRDHWHGGSVGPAFWKTISVHLTTLVFPPVGLLGVPVLSINGIGWFVLVELSAGLLFPFLMRFAWRTPRWMLLPTTVGLACVAEPFRSMVAALPPLLEIPKMFPITLAATGIGWLPTIMLGGASYRCLAEWGHRQAIQRVARYAVLPLTALMITCIFYRVPWQAPSVAVYLCFAILLLSLTATPTVFGARLLSAAPFRWMGQRSYSIYLMSGPIMVLVLLPLWKSGHLDSVPLTVLVIASLILAGCVVYAAIERPGRRLLLGNSVRKE